ncbi:MAG: hypothetical protein EOO73_26355 [Myxococcales bacterium]|nr:MAG: hypothetical protein EOO73_26355 [Myxococcales bacterium]
MAFVGSLAALVLVVLIAKVYARRDAARAAARAEADARALRWFRFSHEIREEWELDLKAMVLRFTRLEGAMGGADPVLYDVVRQDDAVWLMKMTAESRQTQVLNLEDRLALRPLAEPDLEQVDRVALARLKRETSWQGVPASFAADLEAHYQAFLRAFPDK